MFLNLKKRRNLCFCDFCVGSVFLWCFFVFFVFLVFWGFYVLLVVDNRRVHSVGSDVANSIRLICSLREGWCSKRTRVYGCNTKREAYIERGFGSAAMPKVEGCSLQAKRSQYLGRLRSQIGAMPYHTHAAASDPRTWELAAPTIDPSAHGFFLARLP